MFEFRATLPAIALVLVTAVTVGAGGVSAAYGNLTVQLAALAALALHGPAVRQFAMHGPHALRILVLLTVALPLCQLIPLPPTIWQGLPGRDLVRDSLDLVGKQSWFPITMDRARTLVAALGLIAPLAVLLIGLAVPTRALASLQRLVLWLGAASALFGTLHLLNPAWGDLYGSHQPMPGILVGSFADRNAAALFFVCCLLLIGGLERFPAKAASLAGIAAVAVLLSLAVVLTGSRTGIALLALPVFLASWRGVAELRARGAKRLRSIALWGLILVSVLGTMIGFVASSGRGQASIERFELGDGMRAEMREDAQYAARHFWPVGTGMGTFDEVFQVDESLENVSPKRAGRAHMDFLELAIEAGLAGITLAAGWALWFLLAGWRAAVRPGAWSARAAFLIAVGIAAQSTLSFPLRNQAMLCLAAFAIVLLARSPVAESRP